jgi:hypothetical protein
VNPRVRKLIGLVGLLVFIVFYVGAMARLGEHVPKHWAAAGVLRAGRRRLGPADPAADFLDEPRAAVGHRPDGPAPPITFTGSHGRDVAYPLLGWAFALYARHDAELASPS